MAPLHLILLTFLFCSTTASLRKEKNSTSVTIERLKEESQHRRIVVLFCRSKCLRGKTELTEWVNQHNKKKAESPEEHLLFYHYIYRRPIHFLNVDNAIKNKQSVVFYLLPGTGILYLGDVHDQKSVSEWLMELENIETRSPSDHVELDALLNEAETCGEGPKFVVFVHDPKKCPDDGLENVARKVKNNPNIQAIELRRPLTTEMEAVLTWRMPSLSDACSMIIYIHHQTYYEVENNAPLDLLYSSLKSWEPNCNVTNSKHKLRPGLTEIQLEYLSEERSVKKLQENQIFVVVGSIGGIAVIALAISIFWGLQSA